MTEPCGEFRGALSEERATSTARHLSACDLAGREPAIAFTGGCRATPPIQFRYVERMMP
jgi:hypothetical protein